MPSDPNTKPDDSAPFSSRWKAVLDGDLGALEGIATTCWLPVYVWFRASGNESAAASRHTGSFFAWLRSAQPPGPADREEYPRLSDFLLARLLAFAAAGFPRADGACEIDQGLGEKRFAQQPARPPNDAFSRRWALTILENTLTALRREYEAEEKAVLFAHLPQFLSFSAGHEERYSTVAPEVGLSLSALHVAVFRFRQRYRDALRAHIADTVRDAEEVDSELTRLLVAAS